MRRFDSPDLAHPSFPTGRELGLGLSADVDQWNEPCIRVVEAVDAAYRGGVCPGDLLVAINGTSVRRHSLEDVMALLRATTTRPLRLTFVAGTGGDVPRRNTVPQLVMPPPPPPPTSPRRQRHGKLSFIEVRCRVGLESATPSEAALKAKGAESSGRLEIRSTLTADRRRSVVTVRASSGIFAAAHPDDALVAFDGCLLVPPPSGRGLHLLIDKSLARLGDREAVLIFARAQEEVLYTLTLEARCEDSFRTSSWSSSTVYAPRAATENWGLELERNPYGLLVVTRVDDAQTAARERDVVALLGSRRCARSSVVDFGLAADAEAASAAQRRRRCTVALTLAHPELVGTQPQLFAEEDEVPRRAPTGDVEAAAEEEQEVSLPELRDMSPHDRRQLAQLHRLLRQGTGAELHKMRYDSPRTKRVVLRDLDDLAGLEVSPAGAGSSRRIYFDDITSVEAPMSSKYGVGSTTLAASFSISYRTPEGPATVDLSFSDCPALALSVAEGLLAARRQRANMRTALLSRIYEAEQEARDESRRERRPSSGRVSIGRRSGGDPTRRRRRVSRALLLLNDGEERTWWRTLSVGVVVQVMYARDTYAVRTPLGEVALGAGRATFAGSKRVAVFSEGQYCHAVVKRVVRTRHANRQRGVRYVLAYLDGPYDADRIAPSSKKVRDFPRGTLFVGVPRAVILVDFEHQQRYYPLAMLFLTALQVAAFVFYSDRKPGGVGPGHPVVGPTWLHYELISDFPQCHDRRKQTWRLFTYQFSHIGYSHLGSNAIVAMVFGVPVELVHGHLIVFVIYQLGIALGALTCAFSDIHKSVVGSSGGVYCLVGLHTADCLVNWRAMAQDAGRLVLRATLCLLVPALDVVVYVVVYRDNSVSYAAHVGGYVAGLLLGAAFLKPIDDNKCHFFFIRPLAFVLLVAFVAFAVAWYQLTFPPKYFLNGPFWKTASYTSANDRSSGSCCWQLLDCGIKSGYHRFSCDEGTTLYPKVYFNDDEFTPLNTCDQLQELVDADS